MKKTALTLTLPLSLMLSSAQAQTTLNAPSPAPIIISNAATTTPSVKLPNTPELRRKVSVTVPMGGISLESALTLIARSAGMTILTQGLPNVQLRSGLSNVTAGEAISTLINLYAPGVLATAQGNLLIVGQEKAVERVQGVLATQVATSERDIKVVTVPELSSEQFSKVQSLLRGQSVLFDTGRVILSGTSKEIADSQKVLSTLPSTKQTSVNKELLVTRVYTVNSDSAAATAAAIKELTGAAVSTVGGNLVVKAPASQQNEITGLITSLGNKPAQAMQTQARVRRSYDSMNPAADKSLLEALLGVKVTALDSQHLIVVEATEDEQKAAGTILNTQRMKISQQNISYYPVTGRASDLVAALRRELPGNDIQVVEGRNMISVQATSSEQVRAAAVLSKLQISTDAGASSNEMITRSIKLGYTEADTLASALSGLRLLSAASDTSPGIQLANLTSPSQGQGSSVSVFADKRTNSLLLTGPRAQVEEMSRAIANIDVPEKTVRVRLRVEQVNVNDIGNLGIDWSLGLGGVTVGQKSGVLNVGYAPSLTPASISASLNSAKTKGNNKTIIDSNFAAISGQETNFQSGGELLFPAQTNVVGGQTVTTPGQTYGYGLSIKVRPRIAPDGTVVMTLSTDLGSTPASGPQSSIQQTKQTMQSTVMIKKGETVVLGGIITDTNDVSNKGVPGLMDVPVLGALFGTKTNTRTNQALLFIVSAEEVLPQPSIQGANGTERTDIPAKVNQP